MSHTNPRKHEVYTISQPAQLRFKIDPTIRSSLIPSSPRSPKVLLSNLFSLCSRRRQKFIFPDTPPAQKPLRLKFVDKINNECIMLGNERQLDILMLTTIKEEFCIDTRLMGKITPSFDINSVRIQPKKSLVIVAGQHTIGVYLVDFKRDQVTAVSSYSVDQNILGVEVFNEATLLVFNEDSFVVMNMETYYLQAKERISYGKPSPSLHVLSIPKIVDKCVNVFFYNPEQATGEEGTFFSIYKADIIHETEFRMSPIVDVYKLENIFLKNMQIFNYDRQTFLINLGTLILVIKRHYPIDTGELKYRNQNSKLIYLQNKNLLHVCDTRVQAHTLKVHSNSISIKSFDCIKIQKPPDSNLMAAIDLEGDNFVLIYSQAGNKNPREVKCWLMATIKSCVKVKLKQLLEETKEMRDIQDIAEKMGLTKKEIFYELWNQSAKNSKQDIDILLETEDYPTISTQVKNVLKKQCLPFREIERIERYCLNMLEAQIAANPTQFNLRKYIKSHFMLRKYLVMKNIQQGKKRQSMVAGTEEDVKLMVGIQEYQDIRRRNIKTHIIELMKKRNSREELNCYVEGFKFVLRVVFPEFLKDLITQLKDDLLPLLKQYPQLLPTKNRQDKYLWFWSDITASQWDKSVYFEKIQTIDNINVLNQMTKKDWFRWDFLSMHDLVRINKHQFQKKTFVQLRQQKIYYVFLDLLFKLIQSEDSLQCIVDFMEKNYDMPEHLYGKIFLYWELHKFFLRPQVLPGYKMKFQEFLGLKEQDIFRLVFSNEKDCKKLVLTEIKAIYNETTQKDAYDNGILSYFKSPYSTLADLKYILNRINSRKIEFHEQNQNLYGKLVEAAYYKLAWRKSQHIPIRDILVYFQSIPLPDDQLHKLQQIQKLQKHTQLFYQINLDMNLHDFFQQGAEVIQRLTKYYIQEVAPTFSKIQLELQPGTEGISFMDLLDVMLKIRDDLFKDSLTDQKVLEIIISYILNFDDLIEDVQKIINQDGILEKFGIYDAQAFLENIVREKIDRAYEAQPDFKNHQYFIKSLLDLLPKESEMKRALRSHLELGLMLSVLNPPPKAPLIISSRFIEQILCNQIIPVIKMLNIDVIYEYMVAMGTQEPKSCLYQVLILKYLDEGVWFNAIEYIKLWNETSDSVVFSALLIMKIGQELPKDLKDNLIDIVIIYFHRPAQLLDIAQNLIRTQDSNLRKQLITQIIMQNDITPQQYYPSNPLISDLLKTINSPTNLIKLNQFYQDLRRSDIQMQKRQIYHLYYRFLFCQPQRAHQLHSKYYEWIDLKRIQYMYLQLITSNMFNPPELLLFVYHSLMVLFCSNYLGKEFDNVKEFFTLSYEMVHEKYQELINQLEQEMKVIGEMDRYLIMRKLGRIHIRRRDTKIGDPELSMEVQSDDELERMDQLRRSKPFNRLQIKKSVIPPMKIGPNSYEMSRIQGDLTATWKNLVEQQSNSLRMTASIRRKPSNREAVQANFRNTMRGMESNRITGAIMDSLSRKISDDKQSPPSPNLHVPAISTNSQIRSARTTQQKPVELPPELSTPAQSYQGIHSINQQDPNMHDVPDSAKDLNNTKPMRSSTKQQVRFHLNQTPNKRNSPQALSKSELPKSVKEMVKQQMESLFAEQSESNEPRSQKDHSVRQGSEDGRKGANEEVGPMVKNLFPLRFPVKQIESIEEVVAENKKALAPVKEFKPILRSSGNVKSSLQQEVPEVKEAPAGQPEVKKFARNIISTPPKKEQSLKSIENDMIEGEVKQVKKFVRQTKRTRTGIDELGVVVPEKEIKSNTAIEIIVSSPKSTALEIQIPAQIERTPVKKNQQYKYTPRTPQSPESPVPEQIPASPKTPSQNTTSQPLSQNPTSNPAYQMNLYQVPGKLVEGWRVGSPRTRTNRQQIESQMQSLFATDQKPAVSQQLLQLPDDKSSVDLHSLQNSMISHQSKAVVEEPTGYTHYNVIVSDGAEVKESKEFPSEIDLRDREVAEAIINNGDYSLLQKQLANQKDDLKYLKTIVKLIFNNAPFKTFLDSIQKIKTMSIRFHSSIKPQTLRILKNALKASLNFDLKLIYTPSILYIQEPGSDIDTHNKLIFENLKSKIKQIVNETNLFVISKLMSLSFNFNKSFEYRVQYYYLEGLMRGYLGQDDTEDTKMDLEKIEALLNRLPINMTAERFEKIVQLFKGCNPARVSQLLSIFNNIITKKKPTSEGTKYSTQISSFEDKITAYSQSLPAAD